MKNQTRKIISFLLVLVQLIALFPLGMTTAKAENTADGQTPVLNETVVGTVKFQSFNFLGDNDTGEDGTDYKTTFYYSDDYFSPSAINDNPNITDPEQTWEMLDNPSLAACSMDFAVASYTSAVDDVVGKSTQTWNNANYNRWISEDGYEGLVKERNVREFLTACKFSDIECTDMDKRPTNDSIGYTIANKQINVWDSVEETNKTYTLVAVGVRGAGYGAEWASNISIGDQNGNLPNGRHYGFDSSAQKICSSIQTYLSSHNITGEVKYWVTGFSRAAAVANLVAGYLTDGESTYQTQKKDVYGYTWECPQAAKTASTNFTNYRNIHNILNPMDAVPKVSPDGFEHQRLGVDYQMPYHGTPNLSTATHTALYKQMFEVLKTIAVGNGTDPDPLVDNKDTSAANDGYVSPDVYPYKSKMTIYKMKGRQLFTDALSGNLMTNFGTVQASGNMDDSSKLLGRTTNGLYLDQFVDDLIDVFLTSNAWIGGTGNNRTPMQNRATFINNYQGNFRTLLGYFLDFSGPAFMDMVDKLKDAVTSQFKISNAGFGLAFLNFYNDPTGAYAWYNPLISSSWRGQPKKDVLISEAKSVAVDTANSLTNGFTDPQGITRAQMNAAMQDIVGLVINLYAYELDAYESQYFGTTLKYLNTILCTHEQETVLSWIMSVDPNHMNRSCRTITVPRDSHVKLLEFRDGYEAYDGTPQDADPGAPVVAEWENGDFTVKKDARISSGAAGSTGYVVIRYPASLNIRVDVTSASDLPLANIGVDDYQTKAATTNISAGENQFKTVPSYNTAGQSGFNYVTTDSNESNASETNNTLSGYGTLAAGDTLHVIANPTEKFDDTMTYDLLIDKAPTTAVAEYGKTDAGLSTGESQTGAVLLGGTSSSATEQMLRGIRTRQTVTTVPASSIYYDDELTGNSASGYASNTSRIDSAEEGRIIWYKFRGTRIDVYCTTDSSTGYVQAMVTDANGEIITVNGQRMITTMKSASDKPHYNVPTISFDGLAPNEDHYLKIFALKDSNYHLDGIRVYHAADETDSAVKAAYEAAGEQNAYYRNLRDLLVNNKSTYKADGGTDHGILYVDDSSRIAVTQPMTNPDGTPKIDEETGEQVTQRVYENDYVGYQKNSPKNEIYLDQNQGIVFTISGLNQLDAGTKIMIGLSTAQGETASVTDIDGGSVSSALDSYYTLYTIPAAGKPTSKTFTIVNNTQGAIVSVTNLKIAGNSSPVTIGSDMAVALSANDAAEEAVELQLVVNASTLEAAVDTLFGAPEVTPEVTPEPTPEPTANPGSTFSQLLSSFISSLFGSISRMFGH